MFTSEVRRDSAKPTYTAGVSEPPTELRLEGRTLAGRYQIETALGEGGIGVVYRARDLTSHEAVAVKVLRELYGAQRAYRRRFDREARALAALSHPNIVGIVDYGVADEMPYLVMELLEGRTLASLLSLDGPLPWTRARVVFEELLDGLQYVHEQGLLHRDLKPGNVFLQRLGMEQLFDESAPSERVRLLDFGLVKFVTAAGAPAEQATLTRTGELFGTPGYMPPEQILGQPADVRSDVYAASVLLFEILAGKRPFHGGLADMARQQLDGVVPSLQQVRPTHRAVDELEALFHKGLHRDPKQRFANVSELRDALGALPDNPVRPFGRPVGGGFATADTVAHEAASSGTATVAGRSASGDLQPRDSQQTLDVGSVDIHPQHPRGVWHSLWSWLVLLATIAAFVASLGWKELAKLVPDEASAKNAGWLADDETAVAEANDDEKAQVDEPGAERPDDATAQTEPQHPGREASEAKAAPVPRVPARNPWRSATPAHLRPIRKAVRQGKPGNDEMVSTLRGHNRNYPNDPRGNLLLAGLYMNRAWQQDATTQYEFALLRQPSARGDARMLPDLLSLCEGSAWKKARDLVVQAYGREALPGVARALRKKWEPPGRQRLLALRDELQALPRPK